MKLELSKKELQILHELETNARQSMASIAKKARMSKERVSYAIAKLEKKGAIKGYYTLVDRAALGMGCYRVYIKQKQLNPEIIEQFIKFAKENPHVWAFGKTSGKFNFAMGVWARDNFEFEKILDKMLGRFEKDIGSLMTQIMTEYSEYTREYLTGKPKKAFHTLKKRKVAKFDDVDLRILAIIMRNARIPTTEIAEKLGLTERIVRYRMKRMEREGIIVAYRCNMDYGLLGYEYYKVDLYLNSRKKLGEIKRYLYSLPETTYSEKTVYYSDVELDIEVKQHEDMLKMIQRTNEKFPGAIKEFKYYTMLEFYK